MALAPESGNWSRTLSRDDRKLEEFFDAELSQVGWLNRFLATVLGAIERSVAGGDLVERQPGRIDYGLGIAAKPFECARIFAIFDLPDENSFGREQSSVAS